jgi:hypothetical protein
MAAEERAQGTPEQAPTARLAEAAERAVPAGAPAQRDEAASGAPAGEHDESVIEQYREALTMAIYVALSLLAVLLAVPWGNHETRSAATVTVFVTGIGLLLAHMVAFGLAAQLFEPYQRNPHIWKVLGAQLSAGLLLAVVTTVPIALLPVDWGVAVDVVLLLVFIGLVGYAIARDRGAGVARALVYVAIVIAVVAVVMAVKLIVKH